MRDPRRYLVYIALIFLWWQVGFVIRSYYIHTNGGIAP